MPANTAKIQPWKAHWAPTTTETKAGHSYMADASGSLLIDGQHNCESVDSFAELACARDEPAAKAQPWKAHWSPATTEPKNAHSYLADGSGSLLVDGVHNCASIDAFSELACARKE